MHAYAWFVESSVHVIDVDSRIDEHRCLSHVIVPGAFENSREIERRFYCVLKSPPRRLIQNMDCSRKYPVKYKRVLSEAWRPTINC